MQSNHESQVHNRSLQATPGAKVKNDPGSDYLILVQVEPKYEGQIDPNKLHLLAMYTLRAEGVQGPVEVGIIVTTDEEVRTLNKQYLGHDYDTDVLSFSMLDEEGADFVPPPEPPTYLGDVVVSYDRAVDQAPEYGQSTETEVATLMVHGLLHLLGYDDADEADRERMHARQKQLVAEFGR